MPNTTQWNRNLFLAENNHMTHMKHKIVHAHESDSAGEISMRLPTNILHFHFVSRQEIRVSKNLRKKLWKKKCKGRKFYPLVYLEKSPSTQLEQWNLCPWAHREPLSRNIPIVKRAQKQKQGRRRITVSKYRTQWLFYNTHQKAHYHFLFSE